MHEGLFQEYCSKLKLIVSEVDGIITEDLLYVDELVNVPFKGFYRKDFEAINELKKVFTFVFLSSDNTVSYHLCRKRNIPFYYASKDKKDLLSRIIQRYSVTPEEVMYIGCSFTDIACIQLIPFSLCPVDAVNDVKKLCYNVLDSFSGTGVLCEVYNILKPEIISRRAKNYED